MGEIDLWTASWVQWDAATKQLQYPLRPLEPIQLTEEDRSFRYSRHPDIAPGSYELVGELPDVCIPHGQPQARRCEFIVESRPKVKFTLLEHRPRNVLNRIAERQRGKAWLHADFPLCETCLRQRTFRLWRATLIALFGIVSLFVFWVAAGLPHTPIGFIIPFLGGLICVVGAVVSLRSVSARTLFNAELRIDGSRMDVRDPHPQFVHAVRWAPPGN
ncbi:hypothetical protein [Hoyosella subflava]|uniref:Uncharacterized protein n=1 Tax=Hoyosella subflava (strain DSM 45089 / JCM 17490 / NBRC 109087 / DQS3-9A1) TaxID=443218 RepID=F6EI65_HOYSD|nr:hypothetical protein [Hoyosella subflava]AEF41172.1 hypothetical protein AS9A_2725 [Hoyosella subflava DQS3-9A1]